MGYSDFLPRMAAVIVAMAIMGLLIARPDLGPGAVERASALAPTPRPMAQTPCPISAPTLTAGFAPIDDVISVSPLGALTAPGETLPAPYVRINTRRGDTAFDRRPTTALAPARADIVAIERRLTIDADGRPSNPRWSVRLQICDTVTANYAGLETIDAALLEKAGGLASFSEINGPDHLARSTLIRVRSGDPIGTGRGFDVGLQDLAASPAAFARPERYETNPYARAHLASVPPSLIEAITPDHSRARCALEYLPENLGREWSALLGDSWGMRRARGDEACRTAAAADLNSAEGAWFTDASHNAATSKISAIALGPDAVNAKRQVFALHGRLKSLTADMVALSPFQTVEREEASRDFLTFTAGDGRINAPFDAVRAGPVYCYDRLRANFVGPRINGVMLLQIEEQEDGPALMTVEARGDVLACIDVEESWAFSGAETTFYR